MGVFKVTVWKNTFQWKTLTINLQAIQTFFDLTQVIENVFNARKEHITYEMKDSLIDAVELLEEEFEDVPWLLMDSDWIFTVHILVSKSMVDPDSDDDSDSENEEHNSDDDDYIVDETVQSTNIYDYFTFADSDPMIC